MTKKVLFLLLSFLSYLGDRVFLFGLPMYLYASANKSLSSSLAFGVIITISIFIARKTIIKINQNKDPFVTVAVGEILMAVVELIVLAVFFLTKSNTVFFIFMFPLSIIYNIYAPSKFFRLQERVFKKDTFKWTAVQSGMNRIGELAAIAISGYLVQKYSVYGVIVFDCASFLLFALGSVCLALILKREIDLDNSETQVGGLTNPARSLSAKSLFLTFVGISMGGLFTKWDLGASVPAASELVHRPLSETAYLRASAAGAGILIALIVSRLNMSTVTRIFLGVISFAFIVVPVTSFCSPLAAAILFFCAAGIVGTLATPIAREAYAALDNSWDKKGFSASLHWVYNSVLGLLMIPIGLTLDFSQPLLISRFALGMAMIFVLGIPCAALLSKTFLARAARNV